MTTRARVSWRLVHGLIRLGAQHLAPRGREPHQLVQELVVPDLPAGGSLAVMRANHPERFVALLMDAAGQPTKVAKVALSGSGRTALDREADALAGIGGKLQAPVAAPKLVAKRPGVLVTTAVSWRPRHYPWLLPVSVAAALGTFFRSTQTGSSPPTGAAHGDCAPWNLLWTGTTWTLVDWEAAKEQAPPLTDVFHFLVQAHALLKRPRLATILAGLSGQGWVGEVIRVYTESAAIAPRNEAEYFRSYLHTSMAALDPDTPDGMAAWRTRQRLLTSLSARASR